VADLDHFLGRVVNGSRWVAGGGTAPMAMWRQLRRGREGGSYQRWWHQSGDDSWRDWTGKARLRWPDDAVARVDRQQARAALRCKGQEGGGTDAPGAR
jgi:hypothetical protein